jgi:hypothetical protein
MRRWITLAVLAAVVAGGCAPTPTPTVPRWVTTRLPYTADAQATVSRVGAWTDEDWFATVERTTPTAVGSPTTSRVLFFPRTGAGGSVLGVPQVIEPGPGGISGPIGEHILAVGDQTQHFYRETSGVWAEAGTFAVPAGFQPMSMTDDWLALRRAPGDPGFSGDGEVRIYAIASGPTVTATLAATLSPDPSWPVGLREGFGRDVVVDGDLAVVSAVDLSAPTPGTVRIFRSTGGVWSPVQELGGTVADATGFGSAIATDDGPTVDRVVVLTYEPLPVVRIYVDAGSGFALEQDLLPDAPLPGASQNVFGSSLSIDGDLLAMAGDATAVPSADPGHLPVNVAHVLLYRRHATWTREARVKAFVTPHDAGVKSSFPYRVQAAGQHVAVTVLVTPDPPPGCGFFCFNIGFEAWSVDRR